jgi:hypothetical protein
MAILLAVLTALEVLGFAGALLYFLHRIVTALEKIGGAPTSSLAKIAFGVQAIEQQTSHLAPEVTQLNAGLTLLGEKLGVVDGHLKTVATALTNEGEGPA